LDYMPEILATWEAKVGGSQIWGQLRQFSEILSQNKIKMSGYEAQS
jgi:hypothetical protein